MGFVWKKRKKKLSETLELKIMKFYQNFPKNSAKKEKETKKNSEIRLISKIVRKKKIQRSLWVKNCRDFPKNKNQQIKKKIK